MGVTAKRSQHTATATTETLTQRMVDGSWKASLTPTKTAQSSTGSVRVWSADVPITGEESPFVSVQRILNAKALMASVMIGRLVTTMSRHSMIKLIGSSVSSVRRKIFRTIRTAFIFHRPNRDCMNSLSRMREKN